MSVLADGVQRLEIRGVIKTYVYSAVGEKGKNTGPFSLRFSTIYFAVHLISIFFSNLHKINNLYLNMGISTDSMSGSGEWRLGFFIHTFGHLL